MPGRHSEQDGFLRQGDGLGQAQRFGDPGAQCFDPGETGQHLDDPTGHDGRRVAIGMKSTYRVDQPDIAETAPRIWLMASSPRPKSAM